MEKPSNNQLLIPAAIVGAGIIIAAAIIISNGVNWNTPSVQKEEAAENNEASVGQIKPITSKDHMLGSRNADVVIVEFSDLECPFCKMFHETMKQIIAEYGEDEKVAWVYRHFPLDSIHPKARKEAEATECAAELGGQLAFWEFTDEIFSVTPSNNNLDLNLLPQIAQKIGLNKEAFEKCLSEGRHAKAVAEDLEDAVNSGGRGTPYSILVGKDGRTIPISGAQSFETLKATIDKMVQ